MAKFSQTLFSGTATTAAVGVASTGVALDRDGASGIVFQLLLTAAATASSDTLDVKVQTTLDGSSWFDVAYFTQMLGDGGAKNFVVKISGTEPQALFPGTTALTAGNVRHTIGTQFRTIYTLVDGGGNDQSFTFSVIMAII